MNQFQLFSCPTSILSLKETICQSFPLLLLFVGCVFGSGCTLGYLIGRRTTREFSSSSNEVTCEKRAADSKIGGETSGDANLGKCELESIDSSTKGLTFAESTVSSFSEESSPRTQSTNLSLSERDSPTQVLLGSLDLLSSLWDGGISSASKVVNYLSPDEMTQLLFSGGANSLRLDDDTCHETRVDDKRIRSRSPRSSAVDVSVISRGESRIGDDLTIANNPPPNTDKTSNFLHLLSLLQTYSVNTSHPYFFNQLFGSLDPIALAAEIVALSVNTSVYTYETAPVFTLLEREVMRMVGTLVFSKESEEFEGEGLMIPGGSLANLTAMHAARHRWRVINGFAMAKDDCVVMEQLWMENEEEEKKVDDSSADFEQHRKCNLLIAGGQGVHLANASEEPALVAFVSSEAHYSFSKSARVLGIREEDLIVIPTHEDGRMNVCELAKRIEEVEHEIELTVDDGSNTCRLGNRKRRVPFFVACTAGSTVRGSFDDVAAIVQVCRQYESRGLSNTPECQRTIWVHVDGAWGGSAIFSSRPSVRSVTHMDEIRHADSFTFNPHKMLGAPQQTTAFIVRHRNALKNANAAGARYLFDPRKNGAEYDLGDLSYTCGRRTDAVKLWAMWKYYGKEGLGARVDQKVDELELFVEELKKRPAFALACKPWPFNVNFFYFPPRIRKILDSRGISTCGQNVDCGGMDEDGFVHIPDDIAQEIAHVSVTLKLRLHEAGEMIIPYQPLTNQKADCFRLVLAGKKKFALSDICHVLDTMEKYGEDL